MRRHRKGELFRPPTAAESAAHADALEAFRRDPSKIPGQLLRGGDMVVKTPGGGIAGRSGTTIYSAACKRCVESSLAVEKTILESDEPVLVFNLDTTAVVGDAYIGTRLTQSGTRYYSCSTCGGCGTFDCTPCVGGYMSLCYYLTFTGLSPKVEAAPCAACVDPLILYADGGGSSCSVSYGTEFNWCTNDDETWDLDAAVFFLSTYFYVYLDVTGSVTGHQRMQFRRSYIGDPVDCLNLSNFNVPLFINGWDASAPCTVASPTCAVTTG